jgi:integrase
MKGNREHRVALSSRAVRVLESLPRSGELVFPRLAVNAFENVIERIGIENATPHGFRSSFSDWLNDATSFDPQLGEEALAHLIGSSARRAYRRGDGLEKRRTVMEAWAVHCEHVDNVVVTFPHTGS